MHYVSSCFMFTESPTRDPRWSSYILIWRGSFRLKAPSSVVFQPFPANRFSATVSVALQTRISDICTGVQCTLYTVLQGHDSPSPLPPALSLLPRCYYHCCGSGSARIRIILVTLIRIKIYKLNPEPDLDPNQADVEPKCMEYEPILALFKGFEPFFEARIWIRIRIGVKSQIRIRIK